MSDADKNLKIAIETSADLSGVNQFQAAATKATEVTTRWTASKNQLRAAFRGLSAEFPALGRIASLALNPITLAVSGIAAAFKIWSDRMREANRVLGGMELPDLMKLPPDRITAAAEAWMMYAEALGKVAEKAASVEENSRKAKAALDAKWELLESLGGGGGRAAKDRARQEAAEQARNAANLGLRGRAKLREAGGIGVAAKGDDQAILDDMAAQAEVARTEISDAEGNLADIQDFKGKPWWKRALSFGQMGRLYRRYGLEAGSASEIERRRISGFQPAVDRFNRFRGQMPGRDALRSRRTELIEGGVEDLAASQAGFAEAGATDRAGQVAFGVSELAAGRNIVPSQFGAGNSVRAGVVAEIRRSYELLMEMDRLYKAQNIALTQRLNDLQRRMATKPE